MKHRWLRKFDSKGVWHGNPDRTISVDGRTHDLDEYAKLHGVELPDSKVKKEKKTKKEVNSYADMEQSLDKGHTEIDGDGDSKSQE